MGTEAILKQFLQKKKKKKKIYSRNLHHLLLRMANVKSISSHCRFQLTILLSQSTVVANIFHTLVALLYESFWFYGPATVSIYPRITLNQLQH